MSNLQKRIEQLENHPASKGKRIFVLWDDEGITEGGESRTQKDIDDATRQGFDVEVIRVEYVDAAQCADSIGDA
jgi:hypothetical protein